MSVEIQKIKKSIAPFRKILLDHPVYSQLQHLDDLKILMQEHVFAVWDFMALLKALQFKLTSTNAPWIPVGSPKTRRLINEIVLEEESDLIALVVDRESISPNKNFEHKVQVPIGDSEIKVQALDEYGNKSDYVVSIQREFFDFFEKQEDLERLLPGGIQVSKNENRIAVIFGIKGYQSIPDTKYADKDAYAFIDYASYNLGLNPRNIKYFINQDASYFNILDLESWLSSKINEKTEVFVFYSGHGLNNNGEAIILPYDFRKTQIERSSIEKNTFIEEILGYQPGHVYAFFDACFSGLGRENESLIEGLRNISIVEEEKINNVTIFNSSSGAEFSSDLDEAEHGLFSYYLMKGLEGNADLNQDQKITTNELYSYVEDNVSTKALSIGFTQNPSLITSENKVILKW